MPSQPLAPHSFSITTRPSVSSRTQECWKKAHSELAKGVDKAHHAFVETLNDLAQDSECSRKHVHALAGIRNVRRLSKGPTMMYRAFLSKKLKEENEGKPEGSKTMLAKFLLKEGPRVNAEYEGLSKGMREVILFDFNKEKEEKQDTPKNLSNRALSKIVDFQIQHITSICQELNDCYGTESLVLFSRGNMAHTYSSALYASPGAENWLASSTIGHNKPNLAAMQLEGFAISGCTKPIENTLDALKSVKTRYHTVRAACWNLIQDGLENILKLKKHPNVTAKMNYDNYEHQIVERLRVELIGWPLDCPIYQPGKLPINDAAVLQNALDHGDCKWVNLTHEQVKARKDANLKCHHNGEAIYGPPRKQQARNRASADREEGGNTDNGQTDIEMSGV